MQKYQSIVDSKSRDEWERDIFQWVHNEMARTILIKHLLDGKVYEDIAEELGISRATVYNKMAKYLPQLFKHC